MSERCPYCGGDESKCDFDFETDECSEMERLFNIDQNAAREEGGTSAEQTRGPDTNKFAEARVPDPDSDTEELIARLRNEPVKTGQYYRAVSYGLVEEIAVAIAAQAQEIDLWKTRHALCVSGFDKLGEDRDKWRDRAEAAEAAYEELKSTHIEKVEAIRAEYLGQYLSLQGAPARGDAHMRGWIGNQDQLRDYPHIKDELDIAAFDLYCRSWQSNPPARPDGFLDASEAEAWERWRTAAK